MGKSKFDNIFDHFRQNRLDEIHNLSINETLKFIEDNKTLLLNDFSLSEESFNTDKQELSHFLKSLITLNYCLNNNTDIYNKLLNCKNKDEVINTLKDNLPPNYPVVHNICKYIAKEIKLKPKKINNDSSEYNEVISSDNKPILTLDILKELIKENNKSKELNSISDEKIHENISNWLNPYYIVDSSVIDEYILKDIKRDNPNEKFESKINNLTLVNKTQEEIIEKLTNEKNAAIKEAEELKNQKDLLSDENTCLKDDLSDLRNKVERLESKERNFINNLFSLANTQTNPFLPIPQTKMEVDVCQLLLDNSYKYFSEQGRFNQDMIRNYKLDYDSLTIHYALEIASNLYKLNKK